MAHVQVVIEESWSVEHVFMDSCKDTAQHVGEMMNITEPNAEHQSLSTLHT